MSTALRARLPLIAATGAGLAAFFVLAGGASGARLVGGGLLVGAGLLLEIELPDGGNAPLGYALIIALAHVLPGDRFALVIGLGLFLSLPGLVHRHGSAQAPLRVVCVGSAALAAAAVSSVARGVVGTFADPSGARTALACITAGGLAFLGVDLVGRRLSSPPTGTGRRGLVLGWPVQVSLLCGAALLGIAAEQGAWTAAIAGLPLLVTHYSFRRYALARRAYEQTIQALGVVPELAGEAPLGHSERTSTYAEALADRLELGRQAADRLVTAARLHHLHDEPLVEGMTRLLEAAPRLVSRVEAAVLRVADDFDDLVGDDPGRVAGALALVASRHEAGPGRAVVVALRGALDDRPGLVTHAISRGAPLSAAAATVSEERATS